MRFISTGSLIVFVMISPIVLAQENESPDVMVLDGFLTPYREVEIGSNSVGVIESIPVERGDFVQKGDIVAQLDSRLERANLLLVKARFEILTTIDLWQTRRDFAEREYLRNQDLYQKEATTFYALDEAETNWRIAEKELQNAVDQHRLAELEYKQAQVLVERRIIRTPINGVVTDRFLSEGERVEQEPIVKIAQIDPLNVEVIAPTDIWGRVEKGMIAEIVPELPVAGRLTAAVVIVDQVLEAASGTFGIRLELANPYRRLPSGLRCQVRLPIKKQAPIQIDVPQ
ncbi:MAG: efflux RND transporter periplasmic adaptor subunit [Candidatus Omnitrophica bacterium]|nr:efflux RND transporter periplasmic adaptor subunit [Candidatus Omnitrophota bacterium]